jgi:probable phosphoglycerate mutase
VSYFEPGQDDFGNVDPPLNPTGVTQAEALGRALRDSPIDLAVCTGYQRTRQTAELAIAPRVLEIEVVEGLREAQTGSFEEIETAEEMEATFVRAFENAAEPGARFLTGEPYSELWERVASAWQSLLARDDWQHALVAAHGVVNRTLLAQALDAGPQIYRRLEQDTGCLNVLDIKGKGAEARVAFVRLINFTPYNATKVGMQQTTLEMLWQQFVGG